MASYDIEHNVPQPPANPSATQPRRHRPDLSTFYSSLSQIDTSSTHNANALPIPANVSASFRLLGEGLQQLMADNPNQDLVEGLMEQVMAAVDVPPERPRGVPEGFVEGLERVPKKSLRRDNDCPICGQVFLDDEYPLVVRLPCNDKHLFDLECIQPWLKLNSTCPLDRKDLAAKKGPPTPPPKKDGEEEEEEWDSMYG